MDNLVFSIFSRAQHRKHRAQVSRINQKMATPKKSAKRVAKKSAGGKQSKSGLIFPTGRVSSLLKKGRYSKRVSGSSGVYMAAVLEYLTAEMMDLAVKAATQHKKDNRRITPRHITLAVRNDRDLNALLQNATFASGGVLPSMEKSLGKKTHGKKGAATPKA
eukprot:TRINITY_DN18696_c0_g1_i1.p3 TRINITY_DN18696_c0_g1~~TRINITY_DN18696_c0_g1_i1.p3  ORF type:complete len:162 (-),score=43.58 TRINITY_DN18696_c0_g1_i1:94-579(-)